MATCTKCGNELKTGAKFCMKCGTPVSAPVAQVKSAVSSAVCPSCGKPLKPGAKFCMGCGAPVSAPAAQVKPVESSVCPSCGKPLKPGAKFCMGCGTPIAQTSQSAAEAETKGWFTNGVRAVANTITGGQLNRDIQREQQAAVNQQSRAEQGEIRDAQQAQRSAEQAQIRAEREAERARDRRSMEAVEGVDVVRGRTIWNIQPGEIARKIKESELEEIEKLKGIIVQEGCTALIFANGELVSTLSSGAYLFYRSVEEEQAAIKAAVEKAEKEMEEKERKALQERRQAEPTFRQLGVVGEIKRGFNWVGRLIFGEKKNDKKEEVQRRKIDYARILARLTQAPVMSVYLVSNRYIPMTFGGVLGNDGGILFAPYSIPTRIFDVQVGVSLQLKVSDIHGVATNYLSDNRSLTTNMLHQMLTGSIENVLRQALRNVDYQQTGLPMEMLATIKAQITQIINMQLHGIECAQVLQITDSNAEFDRFRAVERELYCTEKELDYLQRTGEFRNRLAIETNKQTIDKATTDEELRNALMQINKDGLIHDDEMEAFTLMLNAQKRLREAKSQEEEYEALVDLKKSRLVKDDELAALQDALAQNKIQRDSVTEIMRIQHQQSIDDVRLEAEWAIGDKKQDHDWEREDLQRRRNWGIEDEQREREWMHEEQEYNRTFNRRQQEDEYDWQKRIRETDFEWQNQERQREADWQQRQREHELSRQDKFDDVDVLGRKADIAMRNMQAMKEAELRELQEQNRSHEAIEINRDNVEANMTAEQLMAKRAAELSGEGQVAFAQALGSGKENELLQKQQQEQKELYQQMLQMQQQQGGQSQEMMLKMAQMMQQGMVGIGQQQQAFQQQRFDDQRQRADEYRQDAHRQQDRMDHMLDQSLNYITRAHQTDSQSFAQAMGGAPQGFQQMPPQQGYQQPVQQQYQQLQTPVEPAAPQVRYCPACGAEVPEGEAFCGECGNRMS